MSAFKTLPIESRCVSTHWFWISEILRVLEFWNVKRRLISCWWQSIFTGLKSFFRNDSFDNSVFLSLFHWMFWTWGLKWRLQFWIRADYWLINKGMSLVSWNCRFMKIKDRSRSSCCCLKYLLHRFIRNWWVLICRGSCTTEIFWEGFFLNRHRFIHFGSFFYLFLLKFTS